MYATGNKKMLNMLILDILRVYTDENHHLTQQEIIKLLKQNYDMECDRRSIRNNVECLNELGYEILYDKGYWLANREFEDAELRMLIDSVLSSRNLTNKQTKTLIGKLENLTSKYFKPKVTHVRNVESNTRTDNKRVLTTVDTLNEAIDQKKKVRFRYGNYGTDLKLHDRGIDYVVNPYQMVVGNSRYYLLCNTDQHDNISYYRIDKILKIELLKEKSKPLTQVKGLEKGLNLPKHLAEHVYMFSGPSSAIKLRCSSSLVDGLVDWFGKDISILKEDKEKEEIVVRLTCNEKAMFYWALQYGPYVEVLEPKNIRNRLRDTICDMSEKYQREI